MLDCEVCGRSDANVDCIIEGTKLRVCSNCSKLGKIVYIEQPPLPRSAKKSASTEFELELVDDYAEQIKKARAKLRLNIGELAAAVGEKESYLDGIENERTIPTEKTARKLERYLRIKLLEEVAVAGVPKSGAKRKADVTLGDIVDVKKEGK
jgi:putative transcription factor